MTQKLYYTNDNLRCDLIEITRLMAIDNYKPDLIIGPGRGGYIPGVMLSHYYGVPFKGFEWQSRDGERKDAELLVSIISANRHINILLVDDINDSGYTLETILQAIIDTQIVFEKSDDLRVATLFSKEQSSFKGVNYTANELTLDYNPWIVFPFENWWNIQ